MEDHGLSWLEVADACWLAAVMASRGGDDPDNGEPGLNGETPSSPEPDDSAAGFSPGTGADTDTGRAAELAASAPGARSDPASNSVATGWAAPVASRSLEVFRELRVLKRRVPDRRPNHVVLDEDATAERSVQDGPWFPETMPELERWLDLTLVVDSGPLADLWEPEVRTFVTQLNQLGAFRRIQVRHLDTRSPAGPVLYGGSHTASARGPAELADRSGRRLMLVVTDTLGECWRRNLVSPLLARWAANMPVALVHLLPQPMWPTGSRYWQRVRLVAPGRPLPNRRWRGTLTNALLDPRRQLDAAVPIPVLELQPRWLRWWAGLVTGHSRPVTALALLAGNVAPAAPDHAEPEHTEPAPPLAEELVRGFAAVASPAAQRLGSLLAAAPVTLDAAELLREELVPEAGKPDLVQVLAGGLLRDTPVGHAQRPPRDRLDGPGHTFEFRDGVRQVLLQGVERRETARTVRLVADRLGSRIPALVRIRDALDAPESAPDPVPTEENRYYVALEGAVLRALGGPYLPRANRVQSALDRDQQMIAVAMTTAPAKDVAMAQPEQSESGPLARPTPGDPSDPAAVPGGHLATFDMRRHPDPAVREHLTEREREQDGRLLSVWGDIPPRNPLFTGREELLGRLSRSLQKGGTAAVLPAALHGMGGIGKTQMAVEFIYLHLDEYDLVWWIQAAQVAQVRKALTELAQQLRLPGSSEVHTAVPAVLEALKQGVPHRRWLLVFDAAEDIDDIRAFFPTNGPGHIVVTSRNPAWASVADALEIAVFERVESIALLRKRDPEIPDEDADALAEKLGDLPLAVEQAAAWRAETGMPVSEYLRLFDEKVAEILSTSAPTGYEMPVAAAWNVSFDELQLRNPAAHQLLQVCAFFAPEPITRNLFTGGIRVSISPDLDAALRGPMQLSRAIRDINRYSLAKIDHRNNTLQLHRLVQLVLRNRMSAQARADMQHGAHALLANFDPNEPKSSGWWPRYQDIWPHVYSAEPFDCDDPWVRQLVINIMQFLYFWGDHSEAATLARKALSRWTEALGETNSQALDAASYLGLYLWALGEYQEAAQLNRRTLELRREVFGKDSEETIIAQLRVAVDVRTGGDFAGAREMNQEIFEKAKGLYGDEDPVTLQTAHDLAVSTRLCGRFEEAFALDKQTFERRGEVLGYDKPDTLNTESGMYMDRRELGDYPRARDEHERMVRRIRELMGADHANTLRREAYLAIARRKAGDHEGAVELSTRALALVRQRYGADHPDAMACAVGLSIDLRHVGQLSDARALGERTFERYRAKFGDDHPHTQAAAVNLAVTLRLQGDAAAARQLNERSLEQLRSRLGPDHPYAIACAVDLASDLAALHEPAAALELGSEALERAERTLGSNHPTTLAARLNVTLDLASVGRVELAEEQYADTLAQYRRRLGELHKGTIDAGSRVRANCDVDPLPT